jgi:hypothetical protein
MEKACDDFNLQKVLLIISLVGVNKVEIKTAKTTVARRRKEINRTLKSKKRQEIHPRKKKLTRIVRNLIPSHPNTQLCRKCW